MTDLLDQAVQTARALPHDMQDEIARMVLLLAGSEQPTIELSAAEALSFNASLQQASNREFASEDQVQAVWSKHGL